MNVRSEFMRSFRKGFPHCAHRNGTTVMVIPGPAEAAELYFMRLPRQKRGRGLGSEALDSLCRLADKHNVTLTSHAKPSDDGGLRFGDLVEWFERRGFVPQVSGEYNNAALIRKPRCTPGYASRVIRLMEFI